MGQCLRGKMAEVGLIPAAPVPAVAEAEAEASAEQVAASVEEAVPEEPALDVTPPAEADPAAEAEAGVDEVIAATFGLLRAEPDGSVVIAGSGIPGSRVEVFANGELLGAVEVEASGDWVFVPESPLPPGGLEITLGEEGKPGAADDSFIVVINEDRTSQPLVVASKPGEASEVLQGLTAPAQVAQSEEPAAPAAADPAAAAETAQPELSVAQAEEPVEESSAMMAAAAPAESEPEATPSADATAATAEVPETEMTIAALPEPAAAPAAATAEPAPAPAQEPVVATEAQQAPEAPTPEAPVSSEPAVQEPQAEVPASAPGGEPAASTPDEPEVAPAAEPAELTTPVAAQSQLADVPLTIDAIEIETDRTFFAGAGPDGGIVRLYVDDTFVADATISEGRWLVEAGPVLAEPSQRVRADLLQPNSAAVVARAEVDFVVDLPVVETPMAVAEAPASEPPAPDAASAPPASEPAPAVVAAPEPATPAVEEPAATAAPETPAVAEPVAQPAPAAAPAPAAPATPSEQPATAAATSAASEPVPAQAEPVATAEAPVDAAPAQPAVPTMVAVSLGDPDAQRFVSGKAIIRRGDNLWTIARRVYGEGLKYTTIYQANTGQIRDPDRIYPGQVFDLPLDAISQ